MKMKRFYVFLILAFGAFVSSLALMSCNDDDDTPESPINGKQSKRIAKTIYEFGNTIEESVYTYDDKGRVIKIVTSRNGVIDDVITYIYGETLINCNETYNNKNHVYSYTIENGLITKRTENSRVTYYYYDSDRHLISFANNSDGTRKVYWSDGNVIGVSGWFYADEESEIAVPWTNSNVPWIKGSYMKIYSDPVLQLLGYWGKLPKNMPSKCGHDIHEYTITDGVVTMVKTLAYQGDYYTNEFETIIWE